MGTSNMPRPLLDSAIWSSCNSAPSSTLDPYNFPIVASTPTGWYDPKILVSSCDNVANVAGGIGGTTFLYDPVEDAWLDCSHPSALDPSYSTAGVYSHGAAAFHPDSVTTAPVEQGPSGWSPGLPADNQIDLTGWYAGGVVIDPVSEMPADALIGAKVRIVSGPGLGQERTITAASGYYSVGLAATRLTVDSDWVSPMPDSTSVAQLETGSFWVWRGNARNLDYRFASYDVLSDTWTPKSTGTSTVSTPVSLASVSSATSGSSLATGSISPPSDCLILAFVRTQYQTDTSMSISTTLSNMSAWTQIDSFSNSATANVGVFWAQATGAPGTGTVTVTLGSAAPHVHMHLVYVTGHDTANPIATVQNGGAIATSASVDTQSISTARTRNVLVGYSAGFDGTGMGVSGGTELAETSTTTTRRLMTAWFPSDINAKSFVNSGTSSSRVSGLVEINSQAEATTGPTFVNSTTASGSSGSTLSINVPSGVSDGHLLLLFVWAPQSGISLISGITGWSFLGSGGGGGGSVPSLFVFYKTASSEPASYTITRAVADSNLQLAMMAYSGAGTPMMATVSSVAGITGGSTSTSTNTVPVTSMPGTFLAAAGSVTLPGYPSLDSKWVPTTMPYTSTATARVNSAQMTVYDQTASYASTGVSSTFTSYTYTDSYVQPGLGAFTSVFIPGSTPDMTNYGKADPSRQGGIHAANVRDTHIYLGGDAQAALRIYSISGDTWSTGTARDPATHPLRNAGGGMVFVDDLVSWDDNNKYLFYWCPTEEVGAYDTYARFFAYDVDNALWIDIFSPPNTSITAPSQYSQLGYFDGKLMWVSMKSKKVVFHDITNAETFTPVELVGSFFRNSPTITGGSIFTVQYDDSTFIYYIEHTNVQGIQPLRTNISQREWI